MDDNILTIIIAIGSALAASGGFWSFLQKRTDKKDVRMIMLKGLAHDRLLYLCMHFIERGSITADELENLHVYLYEPYQAIGGNGTITRLMEGVDKLPVTKTVHKKEESHV
ncbi:MAG: hypothetical protein LBR74_09395 [Eubacterium sp.]|nr:hypothetical protein [Eubacterium sp.]